MTRLIIFWIAVLIVVATLIVWPFDNYSVLLVSIRWLAVFALVAAALLWASRMAGLSGSWAEKVQALSAIVTVAAIIVAAAVYFLERRDQTKLAAGLEINVIRPTTGDRPVSQVLLSIRVPIENKGNMIVNIQCMGLNVLAPKPGEPLQRSTATLEEMQLHPLGENIAYDTTTTRACVRESEHRRHASPGSMRPLFMWANLRLEPNEADDQHFEIPVSCDYPFVRVLFKMRVHPTDLYGLETKAIVSLWDACRGEEGSTVALTPTIQAGADSRSRGDAGRGGAGGGTGTGTAR